MKSSRKAGLLAGAIVLVLAGCSGLVPQSAGEPRKEHLYAVTESHQLVRLNAGEPRKILSKVALYGFERGDEVVAIDFRVSRGALYALTRSGRLYTVDPASGALKPVNEASFAVPLEGAELGMDFNPVVDRIRIVSTDRQNLRAHPQTGALVDADPNEPGLQVDGRLRYANGDVNEGLPPNVMATAYTYNKANPLLTTNYVIDGRLAVLAIQGTKEGVTPAVSPNNGLLHTVGSLGVSGASRVSFDIAAASNAAFAAFSSKSSASLHLVDLETGRASSLGTIGGGEGIRGIAVEP